MEGKLQFIKRCVRGGNIWWSYHSNMRLGNRSIRRETVVESVERCQIIEDYPTGHPLPSCLCLSRDEAGDAIHYVIAMDKKVDSVRFVTVYRPDPSKWTSDFRTRRGTK
jgi:hypothetical protein